MTAETATQRSLRVSSWKAMALAAVVVTLAAAMIPLALLTHWETGWSSAEQIAQYLPLAAVGFLVARRQPRNPIGWLLLARPIRFDAFAARLQDATDPDAVRSDLLGTVHHALEPAQVSLWLAGGPP